MYKIIDIHTHFYPAIDSSLEDWAKVRNENYWATLLLNKPDGKNYLQGFPTEKEFLESMDKANVSHAVIQGCYWENTKTCEELNEQILDFALRNKDRLSAYVTINPADKKASEHILKKAREQGFCGVGELCDSVQKFEYSSGDFFYLAKICEEYSLPICIHCSDNHGKNYKGKIFTDNDSAFELAKKIPDLKFIFAHFGGGEIFRDAPKLSNVFFDTAASSLLYGTSVWGKSLEHNILFGSDYPLRLYPKQEKIASFTKLISEAKENLPEELHQDFFYNRAMSLLS